MNKILPTFTSIILSSSFALGAALVDPTLTKFLNNEQGPKVRILALMAYPQGQVQPRRYDYASVRRYLAGMTQKSWADLGAQAQSSGVNFRGDTIRVASLHWINNAFIADVTPAGLKQIAALPQVQKIYRDNHMVNDRPFMGRRTDVNRLAGELPYDLTQMKMDSVFKTFPQLTGKGTFLGHIDTGVDGAHPALAGKVHLFFNAAAKKVEQPTDSATHGTHTAGTMVGNGPGGARMGMAPEGKLISAAGLGDYSDMIRAMEWMLDPDGNPATADFPRLVSNSWNCEGAPDLEAFYRAITAWEAAGILPIFSAGNAGPGAQTITKPHEHPSTFSVAALDQNAKVAKFSSRGPGIFNGQKTQKPEISAPGVDILSAVPGGKFETMSGTSMSTPHISGLVGLLIQANPKLTPAEIKAVLLKSAVFTNDQGAPQPQPQWNPSYGFGIVDAFAAIKLATGAPNFRQTTLAKDMSPLSMFNDWTSEAKLAEIQGTADITAKYPTDENRWMTIQ